MLHRFASRALAVGLGVFAWAAPAVAPASAAPVTVTLRIEGASQTLFEGPLTTDAHTAANPISGPDSSTMAVGPHPCDYAHNGSPPPGGSPAPTPTSAAYDGAARTGLAFAATWYSSQNDFFLTRLGPDANGGPPSYPSWGFAVNYQAGSAGGCQLKLATGDQVLWAYDFFNKAHLLKLSGPATANVGQPVTVAVTDGANGTPLAGASVGGQTTDPQGHAAITFTHTGIESLKAERSDSIRSNRLDICVHNGNDGTCGTAAPGAGGSTPTSTPSGSSSAPTQAVLGAGLTATLAEGHLHGIRYGQHFGRRHAPRILRGSVTPDAAGLAAVRLRLSRRTVDACQGYDARREKFRTTRCGAQYAPWFSVGTNTSFSYLLPHRLRPGRYVLDVEVIDGAGHRDDQPQLGRNRLVFAVLY